MTTIEHRPWGYFETLYEEDNFKLKRLVIKEGEKISLQKHYKRSEHWHIVSCDESYMYMGRYSGVMPATKLYAGECHTIDVGIWHRLSAVKGDLEIIEYQYGEEVSEEDIQRLEDNYGRDLL